MDKILLRNFLIFLSVLLFCAGGLTYVLVSSEKQISKQDDYVLHKHDVILQAEEFARLIEGMLAAQRGYLLTGQKNFQEEYRDKKVDVSQRLANLSELTSENPSQGSRLDEIRNYFNEFSTQLEERSKRLPAQASVDVLQGVEGIEGLRDDIMRINATILDEEYALLNKHVSLLERQKSEYFLTLIAGIIFSSILLLLFNGFLLHAQRKRNKAERSLKGVEERFALALEGTQDGVFDWDIETDEVFYSRRFFEMLGYNDRETKGTLENFKELLHPEDVERVKKYIQMYLDNQLSEYTQEFRMKHKNGRWVWIQSRAKAIFDAKGKAIRMVGAHTDITAMVKANEKLEHEKEEAQLANEAKSDFLAHMSHEIRTPLTAISGIAEILIKQTKGFSDKQAQLIKTLSSSTASLKELVNDILDFSKIESGELELDEANFALDTIFEETVSMMAVRANEKGISFVFDYNDLKHAEFFGDSKRIRQILVNLVGNAIKFTDKGGVTIKGQVEERDGQEFLRMDISDTGIGIEPEDFDLVFERFKQADSSVSRKYGGTGLGLPISKKLAVLMGGDIFLSSEVGTGSTFSVLLPIKVSMGKAAPNSAAVNIKKLNDKILASLNDKSKVLIVEDYEGNVVVVGFILEDLGIEYDVANNGEEAVNLWKDNHYDVILMDVQMPIMDGFAATAEIRKLEKKGKLPKTPIIGMTAHALVGDKSKCIDAGMDAYLSKPLVEADLKKQILKYLQEEKAA